MMHQRAVSQHRARRFREEIAFHESENISLLYAGLCRCNLVAEPGSRSKNQNRFPGRQPLTRQRQSESRPGISSLRIGRFVRGRPQLREYYQRSGVTLLSRDQILNEKSIQVVAVESAVKDHSAHALLVLQAGKHVHVEKPPADDLNAFKSLVTEAEKRQLLLQVGYMWRYNPGFKAALGSSP